MNPHEGQASETMGASSMAALMERATLEKYKRGDVIIENGKAHGTLPSTF